MAADLPTDDQVLAMRADLINLVRKWRADGVHEQVASGELFMFGATLLREITPRDYGALIAGAANFMATRAPTDEVVAAAKSALSKETPS